MESLRYRDAIMEDLPKIIAIYNSTIPGRMVTADTEPITVESRYAWFKEHDPTKRPLWLIENESEMTLGWISFQSFYGRPAYNATVELSLYIAPEQRGRGIGKAAINYCLHKAPGLGVKTLLGFIFSHNTPSLNLFKHVGFEQWAYLPNIAELDGLERSLVILGKRIT